MARISRRAVNRLLLAAPALPAALAAAQSKDVPQSSAFAACVAAGESGLSAEERTRLEKSLRSIEQSLQAIRDFKLSNDVAPAMHFRPLKSQRRA
jgi:hypothetical protein